MLHLNSFECLNHLNVTFAMSQANSIRIFQTPRPPTPPTPPKHADTS